MWIWWRHCRKFPQDVNACKMLVNLITNGSRIWCYKTSLKVNSACVLCGKYGLNVQSPSHLIFECQITEAYRDDCYDNVKMNGLGNLIDSMTIMSSSEKFAIVATGFRCTRYVTEWGNIYRTFICLVKKHYKQVTNKHICS